MIKPYVIALTAIALILMPSCSSTPAASDSNNATTVIPAAPSDAGHFTINKPLAAAQQSAIAAVKGLDSEIEVEKPNYVQGFRNRHMGLFIGSGGETLRVWLEPVSKDQTLVKVTTSRSFIGIAGQKTWDEDVAKAMGGKLID